MMTEGEMQGDVLGISLLYCILSFLNKTSLSSIK